jgi:hypothetical protein
MKNNKNYVPTTKQTKLDAAKSIFAILFWLIFVTLLAVSFNYLLTVTYAGSNFSNLFLNNSQFMFTAWSVQATVTVLAFFISNIMTSIVQDVFYGLSIKEILTARVKWYEVSFWHQSIMCILLVLLNIIFVLYALVPAVLIVSAFNLVFIIYMLNNAFSYVFNARIIVNRVDKIVQKEIKTGKTTLDLTQLLTSLEGETKRRIINSEFKKATYNINFLVRIYLSLKENEKTEHLPQAIKVLKNILLYLVKTNNFETLDNCLNESINFSLSESEYSNLLSELIENMSLRLVNYTMLEIEEYKVHEHIVSWSKIKGGDSFINNVATSFYNYYNSIILNSKVTILVKNKLIYKLFNSLVNPDEENKNQREAFKIALMHITKDMILNQNSEDFKELLNILNLNNLKNKMFLEEVTALINLYIYYISTNKKVNSKLNKTAKEFLHLEANTLELNSQTLANMLTNSNAHFIKYFWQNVKTIEEFDTTSKLSITTNSRDFDLNAVTNFYLIYWKFFANSLENISLINTSFNQSFYNKAIESLILSVKDDEDKKYKNFKEFCELYDINYEELKNTQSWVENADKIDDYISEVYIDNLIEQAKSNLSRINLLGTKEQTKILMQAFNLASTQMPLASEAETDIYDNQFTLPIIFKAKTLSNLEIPNELIEQYTSELKQALLINIKDLILNSKLSTFTYDKTKPNLLKLLKKLEDMQVDAITHNLSSNIDVLNNPKDEEHIEDLAQKEGEFKLLNELDINEYLFINSKNNSISFKLVSLDFRKPTKEELLKILENFKITTAKNKDEYKIENYYGGKDQAFSYYSSLYLIGDLTLKTSTKLDKNQILKVEIK